MQDGKLTLAEVPLTGDDFGGHVTERADPRLHEPSLFKLAAKPHVGDLDIDVLVEQDILELEVSVDDAFTVEVRDAEDELTKDPPRLGEREARLLDEVVKQFAAGAEFRDEVD